MSDNGVHSSYIPSKTFRSPKQTVLLQKPNLPKVRSGERIELSQPPGNPLFPLYLFLFLFLLYLGLFGIFRDYSVPLLFCFGFAEPHFRQKRYISLSFKWRSEKDSSEKEWTSLILGNEY